MSEYYAVQRSGEYLEHYGVKGMKWGVKKAIASGNAKALSRQYKKASKKLAKLEKRGASGKKYAKRAAIYGAGAAAAGGLAVAGTSGVAKGLNKLGNAAASGAYKAGSAMLKSKNKYVRGAGAIMRRDVGKAAGAVKAAGNAVGKWGNKTIKNRTGGTLGSHIEINGKKIGPDGYLTNNRLARAGAGLVGAGLAAASAKNAYRAATAKRNRAKAAQFRAEMNKAFAGTKYANGAPKSSGQTRSKKNRKRRQG